MASRDAVQKQRSIQRKVDADDLGKKGKSSSRPKAMQAGARRYPVPPFPKQHHPKPGMEHQIDPAPLYEAPYWSGSDKLKGMAALITGGDLGSVEPWQYCSLAKARMWRSTISASTRMRRRRKRRSKRRAVAASYCQATLANAPTAARAVAAAVKAFGRLDVLVNNAAFQVHSAKFEDLTEAHFDTTLKTNLYGYFHMAQEAVPHMKPGSSIINTGSITGIDGSKELVDYSMTKGGIHAFTRALSGNLIDKGIRVNAIAPGPVWTPLNPSEKEAKDVSEFGAKTPMRRPAQPEEIAPAYVFFASPQSASYITGEILPIIGGY